MSGLTVSGPLQSGGCVGTGDYGIFVVGGATLNLSNSAVNDVRESDANLYGCQQGIGIRIGSGPLTQVGHGTITNVVVTGYQKAGIVIDGPGSSGTVTGNTVAPSSAVTGAIGSNGVQISRGASATVTGNTISGNVCNVSVCGPNGDSDTQSAGILLFDAGSGVTISSNTISGSDVGVLRSDSDPTTPR